MVNTLSKAGLGAFADTGRWRLILSISPTGMAGLLKNIMQPEEPAVSLFCRKWEPTAHLIEMVADTVYENPRMLDDFATQIIISTPRTLWIPTELTDYDEYDTNFFTSVYDADVDDIFADFGDDEVCLYTSAPGLNSYLSRTLPGCRISSSLSVLKNYYASHAPRNATAIYIDVRNKEFDMLSFRDGRFMSAASHPWNSEEDIVCYLRLLKEAYGLNIDDASLSVYGEKSTIESLEKALSGLVKEITLETQPDEYIQAGVSHAMALASE